MLIDLHAHTSEYSNCSKMNAQTLAETAIKKGLGGVALTEHDYMRSSEEVEELRKRFPQIKILNAIEVSIKEGEHILVYGVSNPKVFYKLMPLKELEQIVKSENGIMVLAHPFRYKDELPEEIFESSIEGIEIRSANVKRYMRKGFDYLLSRKDLIKVMGTDTHSAETVGLFTTDFKADIKDEADLVKAIRSKEFSLRVNNEKLEKMNQLRSEKIALAKELIAKNLTREEVREAVGVGITYSDIWALKNNYDILYE